MLQKANTESPVIIVIGAEDRLIEKDVLHLLSDELGKLHKIGRFVFQPEGLAITDHLRQFASGYFKAVLVSGLGELSDIERHKAIMTLNRARDVLKQFGCSVIVSTPRQFLPELARTAGDFYDVRSGVFQFSDSGRQSINERINELRPSYLKSIINLFSIVGLGQIFTGPKAPKIDLETIFVTPAITALSVSEETLEESPELETERLLYRQLLRPGQKAVLVGTPGAGKSMLLKYLAVILAKGPASVSQNLKIEAVIDRLPILVPLSAISTALQGEPKAPLADYFPEYFSSREFGTQADLSNLFEQELEAGNAVVMLDGLDEIATLEQRQLMVQRIHELVLRYPKNVYLVTSRIAGYEKNPLPSDFQRLTLAPLDKKQRRSIIDGWIKTAIENTREAEQSARDLMDILENDENIGPVASNPLLLTVLIQIYLRGRYLPSRRGDLYRQATLALAETWNMGRSVSGRPLVNQSDSFFLDERKLTELLGPVAYWLHTHSEENQIAQDRLADMLASVLKDTQRLSEMEAQKEARDFLETVEERSGLIVQQQKGYYAFIHRSFQEYLAACYLAVRRNINEIALGLLNDPKWEEVLVMVADILQGEYLEDYIKALYTHSLSAPQGMSGILIAARCVNAAGGHILNSTLGTDVIKALIKRIEDVETPLEKRLHGGELLGELGDPRLGKSVKIPAGIFTMGENLLADNATAQGELQRQLERSAPAHEVFVAEFYIDMYPVTHQQYDKFIRAGGYDRQEFWVEAGWEWLQRQENRLPAYWDVYLWNRPNYPVIGVSWYEADAYAKWVGGRLPTEAEWEKAARGTDCRLWPWGNQPKEDVANLEAGIGHLTPVGIYPRGKSPYGVFDMAGNVWEWTADWYAPYDRPTEKNNSLRVIRGGAWNVTYQQAYCTNRVLNEPGARVGAVGFRCVKDKV